MHDGKSLFDNWTDASLHLLLLTSSMIYLLTIVTFKQTFRPFLIPISITKIQFEKSIDVGLGFEPGATGL